MKSKPTTNIDDKVGMYRQIVMNKLITSNKLYHIVCRDPKLTSGPELRWVNYFPMEYVPETQEDTKMFVCYDIKADYELENSCVKKLDIYFFISCNYLAMRDEQTGELRTDQAAHEIESIFATTKLGFAHGKLIHNYPYAPITKYRGRSILISFSDFSYGV